MVPDERMHRAAGRRGLTLQLHQEVHRLAGIRTAVQDVADLHQVGLSGGPVQLLVDYLGRPKDLDELVVVAVDVADGDDAVHAGPGILLGRGGGGEDEGNQHDAQ